MYSCVCVCVWHAMNEKNWWHQPDIFQCANERVLIKRVQSRIKEEKKSSTMAMTQQFFFFIILIFLFV